MENFEFYWEKGAKEEEMHVDVPGFRKGEIKVTMSGNSLTIRAHKKKHEAEHGKNYYKEESFSRSFTKSIAFPKKIDPDVYEIKISDGIVIIRKKKN